ncbi:MAG: hypothetical protein LBF97_02225 [Elusimicrobiota bacterium]|jgi:hypothetical protein|nr:hypothetical protein [Elusimicrobiota bacterium]
MITFKEFHNINSLIEEIDINVSKLNEEQLKKYKAKIRELNKKGLKEKEMEPILQDFVDNMLKSKSDEPQVEAQPASGQRRIRVKRRSNDEQSEEVPATPEEIDDEENSEREIEDMANGKKPPTDKIKDFQNLSGDEKRLITFFTNNFTKINKNYKDNLAPFITKRLPIALQDVFPTSTTLIKTIVNNKDKKPNEIIEALYNEKTESDNPEEIRNNFINGLAQVMSITTIFQKLNSLTSNSRSSTAINDYKNLIGQALGENDRKKFDTLYSLFLTNFGKEGGANLNILYKLPDIPFDASMSLELYEKKITNYLNKIVPQIKGQEQSSESFAKSNDVNSDTDDTDDTDSGPDNSLNPNQEPEQSETDRRSGIKGRRSDDAVIKDKNSYSTSGEIPFNQNAYTSEIEKLTQEALKKLTQEGYVKESKSTKNICNEIITEVITGKFGGVVRGLHNQIRPTEKGTDSKTIVDLIIGAKSKAQNTIDKQFKVLDPDYMATRNQKLDAKFKIKKALTDLKRELSKINYKAFKATSPGELNLLVKAAGGTARDLALAIPKKIANSRLGKLATEKYNVQKEISKERQEVTNKETLRSLFGKENFLNALEKSLDDGFQKAKKLNTSLKPIDYINDKTNELKLDTPEMKDLNLNGFNTIGDFERRFGEVGKRQLLNTLNTLNKRNSFQQNQQQKEKISKQSYTVQDLDTALNELKSKYGINPAQYANKVDEFIKFLAKTTATKGITKETYTKLYNEKKNGGQQELDFSGNELNYENYKNEALTNGIANADKKFNPNNDANITQQINTFKAQIIKETKPPASPASEQATASVVTTNAIGTVFPTRALGKEIRRRIKK